MRDQDPLWKTDTRYKRAEIERAIFYHCDQVGTPQVLSNESGEQVWAVTLDTWGQALEIKASDHLLEQTNIRFQGQYYDHETGLHYNRYRYYEPHSARYIGKDPIGLEGGINTSAYVSDPNRWGDPLGLEFTIIREGIESDHFKKCAAGKCRLPFDYAYCSGGAFGVSGMAVINLYDGGIYPGMGKSRIANVALNNPSSVKSLKAVLSANCMLGRIFNGEGVTYKQATDNFIHGAAIGGNAGPFLKLGGATSLSRNMFDKLSESKQPYSFEIGVGTPGWDLNFAGTSSNDPIEYLKSINREMEAKILEKAAKPHININTLFNGL